MKFLKLLSFGGACALLAMIHIASTENEVISYGAIAWGCIMLFTFIVIHDRNKKENERINKL